MKKRVSDLNTIHAADFTSLLDVVMILLFIIMMRQSGKFETMERDLREQTAQQVEQAQREVIDAENDAEYYKTIAEGSEAANEFVSVINLSVHTTYNERNIILTGESIGEEYKLITVTKGTERQAMAFLKDDLLSAMDYYKDTDGIIIIVFTYDDRSAYRQDIMAVADVVREIQNEEGFENVYLREKNTHEQIEGEV